MIKLEWSLESLTKIKNFDVALDVIRMFCQEADASDLYPYDCLDDFLDDLCISNGEIWDLAQINPNVNPDDRWFCGDESEVYSFETWGDYIKYFMDLVDEDEFMKFYQDNYGGDEE